MGLTGQCWRCRHYRGQLECEAYPKGIPHAILEGEHDHLLPYKGDQGVRFTPKVSKGPRGDAEDAEDAADE